LRTIKHNTLNCSIALFYTEYFVIILCDFAISFEFYLLAQKFQFGVIIHSVI